MMLLSWFTVFLCISANTGDVVVWREPGENVTLECCFAECPSSINGFRGMYLYHGLNPQEEVLHYFNGSGYEKITPRIGYKERVEKIGSLRNHTITISNLVAKDSGIYSCVYKSISTTDVVCNVYILRISEPCFSPTEEPHPHDDENILLLVLVIAVACVISIFVTIMFVLLILKLKQWTRSKRARSAANELVYEVMAKNRYIPPRLSSPNQFDFA
ncbi:uncharacterized protein [Paralichthys olivaceus]|uniref:uncharacterized protein n=1 Tax=Paralichthys olivaceus TaxID=8255 RepID=UPI003753E48B